VVVFIDDILVYSNSHNEEGKHLRTMLRVLREKKVYAKMSKCQLWLEEVQFLRHVILAQGVVVDPTRMKVVLNWESPEIVTKSGVLWVYQDTT